MVGASAPAGAWRVGGRRRLRFTVVRRTAAVQLLQVEQVADRAASPPSGRTSQSAGVNLMQDRHTGGRGTAVAFVGGGVCVLAFRPFGWAARAALALLFHLWRHPARRGLNTWTGYAFGLGLMGLGVLDRISIAQFGGVPLALALAITVLFVLAMAVFFALAGWLGSACVHAQARCGRSWSLPASWVLVEWLRGWLFTGFSWLSFGYSQIDLPLAGYGPVLGVYGIGLLWRSRPDPQPVTAAAAGGDTCWRSGPPGPACSRSWTRPAAASTGSSLLQGISHRTRNGGARRAVHHSAVSGYDRLGARQPARYLARDRSPRVCGRGRNQPAGTPGCAAAGSRAGRAVGYRRRQRRSGDYYNAMLSLGASGCD